MKHLIIRMGLRICNYLAFKFIVFYFKKKTNKVYQNSFICAVLSDYLNTTLMLDSKELEDAEVWLITTKKYNFYNLLLNKRYKKLKGMKFVEDYGDEQRAGLLAFCQSKNIKYIFLQSGDFMVPMVNYLNRQLNHKGNSEFAIQCSLDKNMMRNALNKKGVSELRKVTIYSEKDLEKVDFFPIVLKPAVGTGSEGVELVEESKGLRLAYQKSINNMRKTEFNTVFLAEEFIVGRQFDVEGIIHNGEMKSLCIVEENYEGFFPNFDMNWYLFNAILPKAVENKILKVVSNALGACEIQHGGFHCELRINSDGEIKIIELSNRMGGSFEKPISELTGTNFCDAYIQSMLNKTVSITNKGEMMLDKYFKDKESVEQWTRYLERMGITYQMSNVFQRNNKFKISLTTMDRETIYKISHKFGLPIERV